MSLYSPCCIPSENKIGFFWQPPSLPFVLDPMVGCPSHFKSFCARLWYCGICKFLKSPILLFHLEFVWKSGLWIKSTKVEYYIIAYATVCEHTWWYTHGSLWALYSLQEVLHLVHWTVGHSSSLLSDIPLRTYNKSDSGWVQWHMCLWAGQH